MEFFLTSYNTISDINIFTALYKQVETGDWTDNKDEELENFKETLNRVICWVKDARDNERLELLESFRKGGFLEQRILDDTLTPFTDISERSVKAFRKPSIEKFKIPPNSTLKGICEKFVRKEKEKYCKPFQKVGDPEFKKFLDKSEKLCKLTNQMLTVLSQGSYVSEVLSLLINIIMSDLPVDSNIWGIWGEKASSASAERKKSYNIDVEIGYLETGRLNSSFDKQMQDQKKLNRLAKDSIDTSKKQKIRRKVKMLSMHYLTIFTINVAGDTLEFRSVRKDSGLFRVLLLDRAKISLDILSMNPKQVYSLIYNLLSFRTAIACTVHKILYGPKNTMETESVISTSSNMSISTHSTVSSPTHSSQKRPFIEITR
ncbi:23801_t:CDS:2, partial [Dentiscutata erythropus]